MTRKLTGLKRAYELYRRADATLDLAALNSRLAAEGLTPVTDRMFVHLKKLHADDVPEYIPANQHEQWRKSRRGQATQAEPISAELQGILHDQNPWWADKPGPRVPMFRRWLFPKVQRALTSGLAPAVALRGPRRVGKTVLVRQLIEDLIQTGIKPHRILFVPFDDLEALREVTDPVLALARWYERDVLGTSFNEAARQDRTAYIFFDEVQNLSGWAPQLKSLVDNHGVRVLVTGSSSLRIEQGKDSLAGRIASVEMGPLLLREIASLRHQMDVPPYWTNGGTADLARQEFWLGLAADGRRRANLRDDAFRHYSERGAYPIAHERAEAPWEEVSAFLNETVIQRAIQHDLRTGERGRKRDEELLKELMKLCCRYAGQAPSPRELARQFKEGLNATVEEARIRHYLDFLDRTLLLRLIKPMEVRLRKNKSPDKICLSDHSLRASWLGELIPLDPGSLGQKPELADIAGRLAESALGYFLSGIPGLEVRWLPERDGEPEIDLALGIGDRWIPIEVRYRARIDPVRHVAALKSFMSKPYYRAPFGVLVTREEPDVELDPSIVALPLSSVLWMR